MEVAMSRSSVGPPSRPAGSTGTLLRVLQSTAVLSVLTIVWQGATAGELITRHPTALEYHQGGAVVLHVFTALTAIAALLLWRTTRGPLWPTVLAAVVFVGTIVQAALGDDATLYLHVPLALVLMLGSGTVLVWSFLLPWIDRVRQARPR
jgi:heme A synthase